MSDVGANPTHSDEPTDAEEREGMLKMVNATPPANQLEARYGLWISRLCEEVEAGERHLQSLKDDAGDMLCDLEDQVKRLDRQLSDELTADSVLCPHAPQHVLEAKCIELEAELACTTCRALHIQHGERLNA